MLGIVDCSTGLASEGVEGDVALSPGVGRTWLPDRTLLVGAP